MAHHSRLRQRERQKRANREQRNQPVGYSAKYNQQNPRQDGQHVNSLRIDEAPPAKAEGVRQKSVVRDGFAEARKIGKRGVRRKRKNQQHGTDREVIEHSPARNRRDQQGNHALITGQPGIGRLNAVRANQVRDAREKNCQQADDHGQRPLRVANGRLAKRVHAVADGLDSRHCRAAVGEHLQEQPRAHRDSRGPGDARRRRGNGNWMPRREYRFREADEDGDQHRAEKRVRRDHEKHARLPNAAQIHDRDDHQNAQAKRKRVRLKLRHGGNQRAHPGGNSHGRGQHVVKHQRRRGQQAGIRPQIFRRHGVRAAPAWIGRDGLPVGKINDRQQHNNAGAHRHNVRDSRRAQRNEQRQRRLGPVRRRTQRIQAKDRYPRDRPDLFGALVGSRQRLSEKYVHKRHGPSK